MGWCGLDSSGSGWGPVADSCEHGNTRKPSSYIKCWEILEYLSDWWLVKKYSDPKS
jgi:hypothetical protein